MRHLIKGLIAAVAVMAAAPAMACGYSACWQSPVFIAPVAPVVAAGWAPCNPCVGWTRERLPDPEQQYYYVNQGPTYTGPGSFAPYPTYQEDAVVAPANYGYGYGRGYGYGSGGVVGPYHRPYYRPYRYGYGPRYGYLPRTHYGYGPRYGYAHRHAPYYGRPLRRYY